MAATSQRVQERVLLQRRDPLIDVGLARFALNDTIVRRVFERGSAAIQLAAWSNIARGRVSDQHPLGIWAAPVHVEKLVARSRARELEALASNCGLADDALVSMIDRTGVFSQLSAGMHESVLVWLGRNARMLEKYDDDHLDGWAEWSHGRPLHAAWALAATVEVSVRKAGILEALLDDLPLPVGGLGDHSICDVLDRWRIAPANNAGRESSLGSAGHLRSKLADLLPADDTLMLADDLALRDSFFRRFDPWKYPRWPQLISSEADSERRELYLWAALANQEIWKRARERKRLETLCWDVPDPQSDLTFPNVFRGYRRDHGARNSKWFADASDEDLADPE